jgi:hypothetical protein
MTNTNSLPYSVEFWGSHPDKGNDDCHSGADFATLAEALAYFQGPVPSHSCLDTEYVRLTGPDMLQDRRNPEFAPSRDTDDWKREARMQAAMGFGVQAWNDYE